jgi:iron-sulfur cluster insertion protein
MADQVATENAPSIRISSSAARRIAALVAEENGSGLMFRISVSGGGCSGFQYGFTLDDERHEDDRVFERDGVAVVIDEVSLDLVQGSELDYVQELIGSFFAMRNPNATSTCGCGSSFAIG